MMDQRLRTIIFKISGILLLIGAALYLTKLDFVPYIFALGASGLAVCQLTTSVKQMSLRRRRLQTFNVIAALMMVLASVLMFKQQLEWIICLTIAAVLQLYTAFVARDEKD
jgi:multidrug transporter EmrE-like cation transporter